MMTTFQRLFNLKNLTDQCEFISIRDIKRKSQ
jgi:hypothetical protein